MSVIFVLVGQCGNQLGEEILSQLFEGTNFGRDPSPFFTREGKARCVLVDSEPKAIEGVLLRSEDRFGKLVSPSATNSYNALADGGIFRRESVATGESGRGNCWGLGYNGLQERIPAREEAFKQAKNQRTKDDFLLQRALCAIHGECCRVDDRGIEAIIVVHSLAGGTGSGFTSKLVEKLDLHFQKRTCPSIGNNEDGGMVSRGGRTPSNSMPAAGRRVGGAGVARPIVRSKYDEADEEDEQKKLGANPHLAGKTVSEEEFMYFQQQEDLCKDRDGLDAVYGNRKKAGCILAISVSPMKIGENAVQGINGVLTLHSLLRSVHAVILLRNDDALHHMPQPLTVAQQSSDGTASSSSSAGVGGRAALRTVAASATSGTAYHAPQSMHEVNAVFAAQLAVVFQFGTVFGAVGDLLRRVCPLNPSQQLLSETGNRETGWSKIITLVPLPQRAFSRFTHSAFLSSVYRLPTDMFGAHLAADFASGYLSGAAVVPLEQIHRQCKPPQTRDRNAVRPTLPDAASSDVKVAVPRCIFQNIYDKMISRPFQVWPVLVLNELDEVNDSVLFPLLSDAHGKVTERAFIHTFEATGVESEYIELCLRRVANHLCGVWDMGIDNEGRQKGGAPAVGVRPVR